MADIKPLQPQAAIDATVGNAGFSAAYDNAALTPDLLGQLGSQLMNNSAQEMARQRGVEAGLYPTGSALPPITGADKAYVDAYNNQSQATLSLQAMDVFNKADEQMASLNKISAGNIAQYQQTIKDSLTSILEIAPKQVQMGLANQFKQQLLSSSHNYNMKLVNQNKADAADNSNVAISKLNEQVKDAVLNKDEDLASKLYESLQSMIGEGSSSSIYSKSNAETLKKAAKLNYLSAQQIRKGLDSKSQGNVADWEAGLAKEEAKPKDVSWSDWETIRGNAASYIGKVQSLERQRDQLVISNAGSEIYTGSMTAERMDYYKEQLKESPQLFNQLQIQFSNFQRKLNKDSGYKDTFASYFDNAYVMSQANPKQIDAAFHALSQAKIQSAKAMGNPITQEQADFDVAAMAAVPVPAFNNKLISYATSGNPQMMREALHQFDLMRDLPGFKVGGVMQNGNAHAALEMFRNLTEQGKDDTTAAALATQLTSDRNEESVKLVNRATNDFWNAHGSTAANLSSYVFKQLGISKNMVASDPTALVASYQKSFNTNMQLARGNSDVAAKMTNTAFNTMWGESSINGKPEFMFLPPEKTIKLDEGAIPLMQLDIAAQVHSQLQTTKEAYDNNQWDFYYRVKEPMSLDEYSQAKERIRKNGLSDPHYATDKQLVNAFEKGSPISIERVSRRGNKEVVDEFEIKTKSTPFQGINPTTGQLSGSFDLALVNKKSGLEESFVGLWGPMQYAPSYKPNQQWIEDNYMRVNGLNPGTDTRKQMLEQLHQIYLDQHGQSSSTIDNLFYQRKQALKGSR